MKTIESKIAPNPKEAQIWIDLNADAHGLVKKYWNGIKWVEKDKPNDDTKIKQYVNDEINKLKNTLELVYKDYNKHITELKNKVDYLTKQVNELEQFIVTE